MPERARRSNRRLVHASAGAVLRCAAVIAVGLVFTVAPVPIGISWVGSWSGRASLGRRGQPLRAVPADMEDNIALVFVKPHAATPEVLKFLPQFLAERKIEILRNGSVTATEIDKRGIIDAHYAAIAKVGMARDIGMLGLGSDEASRFSEGYGKSLDEAVDAGEVYTALTGMEALGVSPTELLDRCLAAGYEKLRSGLYCAKLEGNGTGGPSVLYVLNGFYARMREKYVATGVVVHWFVVRFQRSQLPWKTFRSEVIGATQPSDAVEGSLRAAIRDQWQAFGLRDEPNYQDNGVHASAGPLEALRELFIWIGDTPQASSFGAALASTGLPVEALIENPIVQSGSEEGPVFDFLEDVDSSEALEILTKCTIKA